MTSVFATKITKVYNALINRINDSIATHNTSNNAHSSLFNNKADITQSITNGDTSHSPSGNAVYGALNGKLNITQTSHKGKNVIVDSTTGNITFEDKPTIPSASSTTPSADTTNGSVGSGTTWAKADHTHPKSTLYAEASHSHSGYLTSQDITGKLDIAQTSHKGKNLVVDATTGNITFEDKPAIVYNNGSLSNLNIAGLDTVDIIINYEDGTSDTVQFLEFTGGN